MKPKKKFYLLIAGIILFAFIYSLYVQTQNSDNEKEYLQIVALNYRNGMDEKDGINVCLYEYSIEEKEINKIAEIPAHPTYAAAYYNKKRNAVYYSDDPYDKGYDNLYKYDLKTKKTVQVTFGKYEFNDIFVVDDKMYLTVAPRYSTVTKLAKFDMDTYTFDYLKPYDNDTWYTSLAYHDQTKRLLSIVYSDAKMRTYEVVAETHIRSKGIILMDMDFKHKTPVFQTQDFEIYQVRQLDGTHILVTYDETMNSPEPRRLKILDITTNDVSDYTISGITEVYSFYPNNDGTGIFLLGQNDEGIFTLYYYDIASKVLETVLTKNDLSASHRNIVDFVYSVY
ncbi:MAG: hypothetical protein HFE60_01260 [Anaerotignum sp.]|jgi:hypothetical protein|nr:hypothetical protein [Anaerotignum sp.]